MTSDTNVQIFGLHGSTFKLRLENGNHVLEDCFHLPYTPPLRYFIHEPQNPWSHLTYLLRKYLLPFRWKTIHLVQNGQTNPVLVYHEPFGTWSQTDRRIADLRGLSLFATNLYRTNYFRYDCSIEFIHPYTCRPKDFEGGSSSAETLFADFVRRGRGRVNFVPIYRIQNIFSYFIYHYRKHFSADWVEVSVRIGNQAVLALFPGDKQIGMSEKILIQESDRKYLEEAELITP